MKLKNPKLEVPESLKDEVEIVEEVVINDEPDVFYFTNITDEDWSTQWNKKIYTFQARKSTKMSIDSEAPLQIQGIRKMFAKRFAQDQYLKSDEYKKLVSVGKAMATTYDEKVLDPWIQSCLKPLPKGKLGTKEVHDNPDAMFIGTKAVDGTANLNEEFYEENKELLRR